MIATIGLAIALNSLAQGIFGAENLRFPAEVLPQDLSHGEINAQLGLESPYTRAVEAFMGSLDAEVARRLP